MKEYGSFFELDINVDKEFYFAGNIKRLNTARCGIYYILKLLGLKKILLPTYLCKTVSEFLKSKQVEVSYFSINDELLPELPSAVNGDTAVLIVNYFGLLPREKFIKYISSYQNVIMDHSQAFFKNPLENSYTVYSPRKFFGVPDGCYVIGEKAGNESFKIGQDCSADTSVFLLKRIESGCEGSYNERMQNEARLDRSDLCSMSDLTKTLLKGIDYNSIQRKRIENFRYAHKLFAGINLMDLDKFKWDSDTVPFVYPLILKDEAILNYLQRNKVFIGRWWSYLTQKVPESSMEMVLCRYMLPLPIDQRMTTGDIDILYQLIMSYLNGSRDR